ncbi:MAG: queuosine precursor transporter [Gammaproteobacteria bacterium]|nr:queuosine precursor transporter [Gammaproteobacteria bacterium]
MSANQLEIINKMISQQNNYKNQFQSKHIIFLSMFCMMIMICKSIFSYRLIEIAGFTLQAGQLVAPLWFTTSDIIAEVYGYKIARNILIAGLFCQMIFSTICILLTRLPHPLFWHGEAAFQTVLGEMWRVSLAVLFSFFISGIINIKLISKWKLLLNGKYFWLRSIGASGLSEILYSVFATTIIQYGKLNLSVIFSIIIASASLKLIYAIILALPAQIIAFLIKKSEKNNI